MNKELKEMIASDFYRYYGAYGGGGTLYVETPQSQSQMHCNVS